MKKLIILFAVIALVFAGCTTEGKDDKMMEDKPVVNEEEQMQDDEMKDNTEHEEEMMDDEQEETMEENFLDVTMMDLDGNEWNLAKLNEKAVIKVWASWCSVCISGMDEYNSFSNEYEGGEVLTVVTPGMFGEKSKEDFIEWFKSVEEFQDIVVILDEEGLLINNLGIRAFPTFVYLDSKGNVNSGAIGHQSTTEIVEKLETVE